MGYVSPRLPDPIGVTLVGTRGVSSSLDGSVAIVTGAGKGIGLGISRALARQGVTVVGVGRDEPALVKLSESIGGSFLVAGLRDPARAHRGGGPLPATHRPPPLMVGHPRLWPPRGGAGSSVGRLGELG